MGEQVRTRSFAQDSEPTLVDRLGRFLSVWRIQRAIRGRALRNVADVGCGHDARLAQTLFATAGKVTLVDVAIDARFLSDPRFQVVEGLLPDSLTPLPEAAFDVIVCNNVIEHLHDDTAALREMHRMLTDGGVLVLNVPSWLGKRFLELAAFRFGVAPSEEMDDHKRYYDPRDLWPLLVAVGFTPSSISCRRHKLLLNTIAVCTKGPRGGPRS